MRSQDLIVGDRGNTPVETTVRWNGAAFVVSHAKCLNSQDYSGKDNNAQKGYLRHCT